MLTDKEIDALIAEVESDFAALAKSEAKMKKDAPAEFEEQAGESEAPAEEQAEAAPAEMPAEEAAPEMEAAPEAQAQEEAPAEEAPEMEAQPEADAAESLEQIYGSMDEQELEEHYEALMAVLKNKWSQEAEQPEAEPEMEAPAPEMEAQPEDIEPDMAQKSEVSEALAGNPAPSDKAKKLLSKPDGKTAAVLANNPTKKSEELSDEANGSLEEAKKSEAHIKQLETVIEGLVKALKGPARKDVTDINDVMKKSEIEDLNKSEAEVYTEAKELAKSQKLTPKDRDILNNYFVNRTDSGAVRKLLQQKA